MLSIIFIILAGISKAFMDYISEGHSEKVWFNKGKSWKLKYKNPLIDSGKKSIFYLFLYKPKYKERFIYSTTILSFLTDGWHFFQMLFLNFMVLSIVFYWPIVDYFSRVYCNVLLDFVIIKLILTFTFQVFYSIIKKRNI